MMATSGKFSGRVEFPHFTSGGLPDVNYSLPYFCPVGCDIGRCACRHKSGAVLAFLGADLWAIPAQSGCRLPRTGRRGTASRGRAPVLGGAGVWTLGPPHPRTGVAPERRAGRLPAGALV